MENLLIKLDSLNLFILVSYDLNVYYFLVFVDNIFEKLKGRGLLMRGFV